MLKNRVAVTLGSDGGSASFFGGIYRAEGNSWTWKVYLNRDSVVYYILSALHGLNRRPQLQHDEPAVKGTKCDENGEL